MKKLIDIKQTVQDADYLINAMHEEIKELRVLLYRYNQHFGNELPATSLTKEDVPDTLSQAFGWAEHKITVNFNNYVDIGIDSPYMRILKQINNLS